MNFFLGIIVGSVLLGTVAIAQEHPLEEANEYIQSYHRLYEGTKDNVRFYMADTSRPILDQCVQIVSDEIERWDSRKLSCRNLTPRNTEEIGDALRDCASEAAETIYAIQNNVYMELEEMQRESVQLQFTVMRMLIDFNLLRNYMYFLDEFMTILNDAYNRLQNHFVPVLEEALEPLLAAEGTLPQQTQACVDAISRRFRNLC
ncbi:uncharacterized protein LOC129809964 [Phlebotomus papatasi]|uniref:uncharacterized protein LOC129809964 n=1 Tax=Phlebotomus papatasi TaxID=29031 RepID=UPI002483CE47|nr:uncharacterized protein LOC129809964 [Phlebotomus papatasi]